MRVIPGGNLSAGRIGFRAALLAGRPMPFGYVPDGTADVEVDPRDYRFTPAERAAKRARVQMVRFPGYPIVIDEDTIIEGGNFSQAKPHSAIFAIAPGVRVIFRGNGTFVNVSLPDSLLPGDFTGNNAQGTNEPTGNPEVPTFFRFCECEKCSTFQAAFEEAHRTGAWDAGVTIIDLKAAALRRREDPKIAGEDVARQLIANEAALARKRELRPSLAGSR